MSAEVAIKVAQSLRKERRYQEAYVAAKKATDLDPKNADGWWQMGLNAQSLADLPNAMAGFKETVRLAPKFGNGWAQYAKALAETGKGDEAERAFLQAARADPANEAILRLFAEFCAERKDTEGQLRVLQTLDRLGKASSAELCTLGILHHNKKFFGDAIRYYQRSAKTGSGKVPLFNLGLVYNDPEVSQDADAVDSYRRALEIDIDYERAKERLAVTTPRLVKLAEAAAASGETLLLRAEWFQHYINPFELLNVSRDSSLEELDPKTLQRLKKAVLQEIALENGCVSWLEGAVVDQSRALGICDELFDEERRAFHWTVFEDRRLLDFLSRGEHRHFLYHETYSPLGVIEALEDDESTFRACLSEPFARQYNFVLSRAFESETVAVIEALFDGRRWVLSEHDDICFEGAYRYVDRLLGPLRTMAEGCEETLIKPEEIERIFRQKHFLQILNLLPANFRAPQSEAVRLVRKIAISAHNKHGDSELSKTILGLSNKFVFKSADLTHQLQEDFKKIEELIKEQRKDEAKLTFGKIVWEVTKEGVRQGNQFLAVEAVKSIRWGILVSGYQCAPIYEFVIAFRDDSNREAIFSWKSEATPKDIKPEDWSRFSDREKAHFASSLNLRPNMEKLEEQERHYNNLVQAALSYIMPTIMAKISAQLEAGHEVVIGVCKLRKEGVGFTTQGLLFSKAHLVPWSRLGTHMERGIIFVYDRSTPGTRIEMPIRSVDNAFVLSFLTPSDKEPPFI